MAPAALNHTATRLLDGNVLVAGGFTFQRTASAEIYDPATGTFSLTGSMAQARASQTATRLLDGKVLVAGGSGTSAVLASAELYSQVIEVTIDIKPGEDPPSINPKSRGKIPVAILSSSAFDATTQVDRTSLVLPQLELERAFFR